MHHGCFWYSPKTERVSTRTIRNSLHPRLYHKNAEHIWINLGARNLGWIGAPLAFRIGSTVLPMRTRAGGLRGSPGIALPGSSEEWREMVRAWRRFGPQVLGKTGF